MSTSTVLWIIAGVVVILLWLNGRYWRNEWSRMPEITCLTTSEENSSATAVIFFAGAFNSARLVSYGMVDLWERYGDVHLVEYPLRKFNMHATTAAVAWRLAPRYDRLILIGASMGGICCMHYRMWNDRFKPEDLKIIGCDVPQSKKHLLWAARLARFVHPGPIFNFLLSGIVTRLMFKMAKADLLSEGADTAAIAEHIAGMRRYRLSAMLDQIATIAAWDVPSSWRFEGIDAVYLRSESDAVIKADQAEASWFEVFEGSGYISVPRAFHVTFAENVPEWKIAFGQAFEELELTPVR